MSALRSLKNVAKAALNPVKAQVMLNKVWLRFFDKKGRLSEAQYKDWLKGNSISTGEFLKQFPEELQQETEAFRAAFYDHVTQVWSNIPYKLGGGANVPLIYMLTRVRKPAVIVETGVASGMSSGAFLKGLQKNGSGKLFSSDFPYFRIENAEKYIGIVVQEDLRQNWTLLLKGDEANLPEILAQVDKVDIFHYDSDKSYKGRQRALDLIRPQLKENGLIVMDDIQDNAHFYDIAHSLNMPWQVIEYKGKYIGLLGKV